MSIEILALSISALSLIALRNKLKPPLEEQASFRQAKRIYEEILAPLGW